MISRRGFLALIPAVAIFRRTPKPPPRLSKVLQLGFRMSAPAVKDLRGA
jgi:hypothetical protein